MVAPGDCFLETEGGNQQEAQEGEGDERDGNDESERQRLCGRRRVHQDAVVVSGT